jgi:hypothetical protein
MLAVKGGNMDDGEHIKEVYAHFGLSIYLAQVFEHGIVNALVYADLVPRRAGKVSSKEQWASEFDIFMEGNFEHTLGKLIKIFQNHVTTPVALEQTLKETLKLRNFLAHGFFRERAVEFVSFQGREKMLKELERAQQQFERADKELEAVVRPFRLKIGFTDERLEKAYEELCYSAGVNC